jgi:hypothetical protein
VPGTELCLYDIPAKSSMRTTPMPGHPRSAGERVTPRSRSEVGTDRSQARVGRRAQGARATPSPSAERRADTRPPGGPPAPDQRGRSFPGSFRAPR